MLLTSQFSALHDNLHDCTGHDHDASISQLMIISVDTITLTTITVDKSIQSGQIRDIQQVNNKIICSCQT